MAFKISSIRLFLKRNQIFFYVIFGLIAAMEVFINLPFHPNVKENPKNEAAEQQTQRDNNIHPVTKHYSPHAFPNTMTNPHVSKSIPQSQQTASVIAPNSNIFIGPNSGTVNQTINTLNEKSYEFDGTIRQTHGGVIRLIEGSEEHKVFIQLDRLEKERKYPELLSLCKTQITKTPDWLTPYYFLGFAQANTGLTKDAISTFEYVIKNSFDDPHYQQATEFINFLKKKL